MQGLPGDTQRRVLWQTRANTQDGAGKGAQQGAQHGLQRTPALQHAGFLQSHMHQAVDRAQVKLTPAEPAGKLPVWNWVKRS